MSFTFFNQSFLLLSTIFDCKDGFSYVSKTLKCRTGKWFSAFGPMAGLALFLQSISAIITTSLYFKSIFINTGSDLLKKTNTFPDFFFTITKIFINIIFISDKEIESEHWLILFFLILLTGMNAHYTLYYQNRANKSLTLLSNIFCLITFLAYISLFVGKLFKSLEFTGAIYLFFCSIVIIIIFIFIFKNDEIDYILIDYREINNPVDYLYYVSKFYNIIHNINKSRNNLIILKSLISQIEQNCILTDCPLKKYMEKMKNGIECPFLLNEYCQRLFEYGISKFPNDNSLKNNYSIFLITAMNNKKRALIILNSIKNRALSFQSKFDVYRSLRLIDKWKFSQILRNNSTFEYRKNIQEFKKSIKKLILLYYDFMSLLLNTKLENIDNFNKIHKIGLQIMKLSPILEEIYTKLISIKNDNIEIIKISSEFVGKILKDEEKLEKNKKIAKLSFNNAIDIHEKDFANFDLEILNGIGHIPYLIISTYKEHLGEIIDLSLKITKIFGYTKFELIGQHINILIPKIFQKKHNEMILEHYEKNKLQILDNINKKKIYFPDFIKINTYGISKMKFLVELTLNVYLVKTEENKLVYIVEITNYTPSMIDLIKSYNNHLKCCILTDNNFLIQAFTPNCLEQLKLNYEDINSNYSIINYIKQFQDDYLTAINLFKIDILQSILKKKYMFKFFNKINNNNNNNSHINNSDLYSDEKLYEKRNNKYTIPTSIKKKIKIDLLFKKYSKKGKITWRIANILNSNNKKGDNNSYITQKSQNSIRYTKSKVFKQNKIDDNNDFEIDVFMEIKHIMINKELLGYFFYFTKVKNKNYNNMTYVIQKNETFGVKNDITKLKLKKYQCKFVNANHIKEDKFRSGKNQLFSSFIEKSPDINIKNDKSCLRKKTKKRSLEQKSSVSFTENKNLLNIYSIIRNKNSLKKSNATNDDTDTVLLSGDFVPEFSCHFSLNLSNLSFIKETNEENKINYLEQLQKEAHEKINKYEKLIKFISRYSKTSSNESEENESNELSSSDKIYSNSYLNNESSNTNSNSLNENKKEQSLKIKDSQIYNKDKKENDNDKIQIFMKKENFEINSNINTVNNSNKNLPKKEKRIDNFYRVNLNKIIFMIYDFNKDMIVEDNKYKNISKMERIMTDPKNHESIELERYERFSFFPPQNNNINSNKKNKKNKIENLNDKPKNDEDEANSKDAINTNQKANNKLNDGKLTEKKVYESLKKLKNEPPVKRLSFFSFLFYFFMIVFGILCIIFDSLYLEDLQLTLRTIKDTMFLSFYSHISVYYLRELTLLNFNIDEIEGGKYLNYPGKDKNEYINLIKIQLSDLFIENQKSLKSFCSSKLSLNKNIFKLISETQLNIKMSSYRKINMNYDIYTALMQYGSAFYNLASSTSPISQNYSDIYVFIYNNLNGYKKGINLLINGYSKQLGFFYKEIIIIILTFSILVIIIFLILYFFIILNFISSIKARGKYMKVFYGINESILKKIIYNCENLLNKLKSFEELNYHEEETSCDNIDGKVVFGKNQSLNKKEKSLYENYSLNESNEKKAQKNIFFFDIVYIILYGVFILICFLFYLLNGLGMVMKSSNSILKYNICQRILDIQIEIIDSFNVYREFLFDNQSMIDGLTPLKYLDRKEKEELSTFNEKIKYLNLNMKKTSYNIANLSNEKTLCSYYINDFYDSSIECEDDIGLITKYDFYTLAIYFLEEIKIEKNVVKYKLIYEHVLGNLTEYNYSDYINNEMIPRKGDNLNNTNIFRLNLFNNVTKHYKLNIIFFSILLPFIQENKNKYFSILSFDSQELNIISLNIVFLVIATLIFFCFFIPIINYINSNIYKTKSMLSIIPLSILSFQSDALILLNISNNK